MWTKYGDPKQTHEQQYASLQYDANDFLARNLIDDYELTFEPEAYSGKGAWKLVSWKVR